jgi:heat shock protein beta
LTDYVERLKKNQEQIYYLGGENLESVQNSPLIEKLVKKGYEVLFMVDPIDEYALQHLDKFDGKYKLSNIGREGVKFDSKDSKIKEAERESKFVKLTSYLKEKLAGKIDKAVVSTRLTTSPAAMVAGGMGWTANMHRLVKAQTMTDSNTHSMYAPRKTLEINPNHPIIVELQNKIEANEEDPVALDVANLLYDTAALTSGFTLDDQADFASRIVKLLNKNLDLDPNAAATEDAEDAEEEEVEEKAANEEEEEEPEEVVLDNKDEL